MLGKLTTRTPAALPLPTHAVELSIVYPAASILLAHGMLCCTSIRAHLRLAAELDHVQAQAVAKLGRPVSHALLGQRWQGRYVHCSGRAQALQAGGRETATLAKPCCLPNMCVISVFDKISSIPVLAGIDTRKVQLSPTQPCRPGPLCIATSSTSAVK